MNSSVLNRRAVKIAHLVDLLTLCFPQNIIRHHLLRMLCPGLNSRIGENKKKLFEI